MEEKEKRKKRERRRVGRVFVRGRKTGRFAKKERKRLCWHERKEKEAKG